jgi:glycerol kinase
MTRGTGRAHLVRATLEAIAYQSRDVLEAMERDAGCAITILKVDGGASANNLLMQFQADILPALVMRPACVETTAQGAAFLAGLSAGVWKNQAQVGACIQAGRIFEPRLNQQKREQLYAGWLRAVERSRNWQL